MQGFKFDPAKGEFLMPRKIDFLQFSYPDSMNLPILPFWHHFVPILGYVPRAITIVLRDPILKTEALCMKRRVAQGREAIILIRRVRENFGLNHTLSSKMEYTLHRCNFSLSLFRAKSVHKYLLLLQ